MAKCRYLLSHVCNNHSDLPLCNCRFNCPHCIFLRYVFQISLSLLVSSIRKLHFVHQLKQALFSLLKLMLYMLGVILCLKAGGMMLVGSVSYKLSVTEVYWFSSLQRRDSLVLVTLPFLVTKNLGINNGQHWICLESRYEFKEQIGVWEHPSFSGHWFRFIVQFLY